jgi:hypothetical protein
MGYKASGHQNNKTFLVVFDILPLWHLMNDFFENYEYKLLEPSFLIVNFVLNEINYWFC